MAVLSYWRVVACCLLVCEAGAQDLPPELLLLSRIKLQMRQELAHMPNYTCLETIARFRKEASSKLAPTDTVRLEIVYADHKEWFGSAGQRQLTVDNPAQFVGNGMIGNGAFATTLSNVFEGATFAYQGEEVLAGRVTVKYSFHLPRLLQASRITLASGSGTVGEDGFFWADQESLDLVRLDLHAVEIPLFLDLEETSMSVRYARTRIKNSDALLAQEADLHMLDGKGVESYDRLDFTHCRAFSAESVMWFDPPPHESVSVDVLDTNSIGTAPANLTVTMQFTTRLTEKDSIGTPIEGKVQGDVVRRGKVVIPNGAVMRGRVRRLERAGEQYFVGLEFIDVQSSTGPLRFYADLMRIEPKSAVQISRSESILVRGGKVKDSTVSLPGLPGVASFVVSRAQISLSENLRMVWRTRVQAAPSN